MSLVRDVIMSASLAVGNVASRERDRELSGKHDDGRPKALGEKARERVNAVMLEGAAKIVVSQTAHLGAKALAKRVGKEALKKVFGMLAKRPMAAAGAALFVVDTARDGVRLARGEIDSREFAERVGGNGSGLLGAAGGAYVGGIVGTIAFPVVGTAVGTFVGGIVGGIGGDTYGRRTVQGLLDDDDDESDNA